MIQQILQLIMIMNYCVNAVVMLLLVELYKNLGLMDALYYQNKSSNFICIFNVNHEEERYL